MLSVEFPTTNGLPFFFQTDGNFNQMISSHALGRGPNKSLIKYNNILKPSQKKRFKRTKDNFNVNQFQDTAKHYPYVKDKCLALFQMGNSP